MFLLFLLPLQLMRRKWIIIASVLMLLLGGGSLLLLRGCDNGDGVQSADTVRVDTVPFMLVQMQRCSRINTAEVRVHKIVTHDDVARLSGTVLGKEVSLNLPAGRRKVAIPLYATVKASVDVSRLTAADIIRHGDKVEVMLPQPDIVITETHVDHDGIRQYVALTRSKFTDEEMQAYVRQGREAIERDLKTMNIMATARESAARQLIPIIQAMGFSESNITISFRDNGRNNTILRESR